MITHDEIKQIADEAVQRAVESGAIASLMYEAILFYCVKTGLIKPTAAGELTGIWREGEDG